MRMGAADGNRWPADLRGVTETLVTTEGPNGRWNVAALGVHAPGEHEQHPTARTWGHTRTWRNFDERGGGYVQFTPDPVTFVDAALSVVERPDPILVSADAWVRVDVAQREQGQEGETIWTDWSLRARESEVRTRRVHTFNRGYAAVVEASVAASRLDVPAYDADRLRERIDYFEEVCERCGGPDERAAFDRLLDLIDGGLH